MYFEIPTQLADQETEPSTGTTTRSPSDTLPYREALEETERKQREEYLRDCANVRVLETLERQPMTPGERVRFLERKLAAMPRIIQGNDLIKQMKTRLITGRITEQQFRNSIPGILHAFPEVSQFPFPPGYAVRSLAEETAIVKCQLSKARWAFMVWNRTHRMPGERRLPGLGEPLNPPDPVDVATFLLAQGEIKKQLERNFRAEDEPGYLDRRARLRAAFHSVPKSFAGSLLDRFFNKNDPLTKLFFYKLHPATQAEMISILQKKLDVI